MVHETNMFDIGEIIDTCQKLKSITGKLNVNADIVKLKAVLISKIFVIKEKIFS